MHIAIVTIGNLYRLPYINRYTDHLPNDAEVDIVYWNRESKKESFPSANLLPFHHPISGRTIDKAIGYLKYRQHVVSTLTKNKYDRVIVTPTQTGLLLFPFLTKHYPNKFIFDIRDYCHENFSFVRWLEAKTISKSFFTAISSDGYKSFLPNSAKYKLVHNDRQLDPTLCSIIQARPKDRRPLCIGTIGYIAYHDQHKKMIDLFRNDDRFELVFAGAGSEPLQQYCKKTDTKNVTITGSFDPQSTLSLYESIDIINGIYGKNCPELDFALSNKLYFAAALHMPIISNPNTFMEKISTQYGFGWEFDSNRRDAKDLLYERYYNLDWKKLTQSAEIFLNDVKLQNTEFEEGVETFFEI